MITSISHVKKLEKMTPYLFWTCWSPQMKMADWTPLSIGSQLTQTSIYTGDSHHAITSKYSMIGTLYHRARTICSNPGHLQKEEKHLFKSLRKCKYPDWALNRVKLKGQSPALKKNKGNSNNPEPSNTRIPKPYIVVPYHQGLSESFKRTGKKYGIEVHLKGGHTIKDLLMALKDKDPILKKSGVIYRYKCDRVDCDDEYIGESTKILKRGLRNIWRPLPIYMTTLTSLAMLSLLTIFPYWGERTKTSWEP